MYLSGIFALDLHFKYKILSPSLKKKKKKRKITEMKNWISRKISSMTYELSHIVLQTKIFSNRVKVSKFPREDFQFRRSIIIQKKNTTFRERKKKKRDISRRYQQGDSSRRGRELRSQFVKKFVPKEEEKGEGEGKRKYVSRLESMAAKGKRDVT